MEPFEQKSFLGLFIMKTDDIDSMKTSCSISYNKDRWFSFDKTGWFSFNENRWYWAREEGTNLRVLETVLAL